MYWGQNGKALMNDEIPNSFKEGFIDTKLGKIQYYKKEGKSENKPNQKNIEEMFLEATEKLQNNKKVILIGRSLGTGFSTYVANHIKNVEGLVLITPYSKITDVACERFIYVPSIICSTLMENQMDNVKNLSNINEPIFIIFANGDSTILNENTKSLINSKPTVKSVEVFNTNHNSVLNKSDTKKHIKDFIDSVEKKNQSDK